MGVWAVIRARRAVAIGLPLAAMLLVGLFAQSAVHAAGPATVSLSVSGCSGSECNLDNGEDFTLSVNVTDAPNEGYVLMQSFVDYGPDLTYNMTAEAADEVTWPDVSPDVVVRNETAEHTVGHGGLTGIIPPLPVSTYEGEVFSLSFTCSDQYSSTDISLLPYGDPVARTNGTSLTLAGGDDRITPKTSGVTVTCGEPPTPTPTGGAGPTSLPPTGSGALGTDGGTNTQIWLAIAALLAAGVSTLGALAWNVARSRRD